MTDYLLTGLGNPGAKYEKTRHNIGFMVVDLLSQREGATFSDISGPPPRQQAEIRQGENRIILLKPLTFMNRSGEAVAKVKNFFKIPLDNLLIIQDDLDMEFGRIKVVRAGRAGGHNGIRSIISALGSREFPRLKIGIGRPDSPMPVDRYVLSRFSGDELQQLDKIVEQAADAAECFIAHGLQETMNRFNGKK